MAVTKDVDFWDFLGNRDLEGYQMWAWKTLVTLSPSLANILCHQLSLDFIGISFIRFY